VRPDAQRQCEHGGYGEARIFEQHSRAVMQVLPEVLEAPESRNVTIAFFRLLDSAETYPRRAPRLLLAHPAANVLRRLHLQMNPKFAFHLAFDLPTTQAAA